MSKTKKITIELTESEVRVLSHAAYLLGRDSKNALLLLRKTKLSHTPDFEKEKHDKLKMFSRTGTRLGKKLKELITPIP